MNRRTKGGIGRSRKTIRETVEKDVEINELDRNIV